MRKRKKIKLEKEEELKKIEEKYNESLLKEHLNFRKKINSGEFKTKLEEYRKKKIEELGEERYQEYVRKLRERFQRGIPEQRPLQEFRKEDPTDIYYCIGLIVFIVGIICAFIFGWDWILYFLKLGPMP